MNQMFRLGISQKELMERGVKLGADVPYCIMRGTVLAEGIGEKLTPASSDTDVSDRKTTDQCIDKDGL